MYVFSVKLITITFFRFIEILELVDDLVLDIPKVWLYLAEILCK